MVPIVWYLRLLALASALAAGCVAPAIDATPANPPAAGSTEARPAPQLSKPGSFADMPRPAPPDYSRQSSWAALPTMNDAADLVPAGDRYGDRQAAAAADVFYIHPTTYRGLDNWNQSLDDEATNQWTDVSVVNRQAAVFNACCKVYAPRYRQAQAAASVNFDGDGGKAYAVAYEDVRAAFRYYLEHWNHDRPFILAGHSQGALHVQTLLREFGVEPTFRKRLVAAYVIGIPTLEAQRVSDTPWLTVCARPTATHCLLGWNATKRDSDMEPLIARNQERLRRTTGQTEGAQAVCVNPLTFDVQQPAASAATNPGTLPGKPGPGPLPATRAGVLGASCDSGYLRTDLPPGDDYATIVLPGGSLHFNEFDFFFDSIRANAITRVESFRR
ncbi:MAG TPA: DUF3089 domain-containing protein [Steroidobacteraceae bacterium]|nr:DUF3089 domain-containing protein [Steroidobacteraceae bacterium]